MTFTIILVSPRTSGYRYFYLISSSFVVLDEELTTPELIWVHHAEQLSLTHIRCLGCNGRVKHLQIKDRGNLRLNTPDRTLQS